MLDYWYKQEIEKMEIKELLVQEIAPGVTVQDLINAYHDVLDGTQDHDIHEQTVSAEDEARAIRVRRATEQYWEAMNG